jgi:hypothetical protein
MTRNARPAPLTRFIYVIGPEQGLQKVGLATDPRSRLATLQTASPFDLLLHASVAVPFGHAHTIERHAHRLLVRSCVRNEWFETTPADAIAAVHAAGAPWIKKAAALAAPANPPVPSEWRISRAERKPMTPPDLAPLMEFGRQFRPGAAFHKAPSPAPLPLFDYQPPPPSSPSVAPDTPIDVLDGYRMELHCCGGATTYPLALLAQSLPQGGRTTLGAAIGLFRCERCRQPTREAVLVEQDGRQAGWRVEKSVRC